MAGSDGFEDRRSLGAVGQTEGSVLNVATGEDGSVGGLQRGTDGELGVGRVGMGRGSAGGLFEVSGGHGYFVNHECHERHEFSRVESEGRRGVRFRGGGADGGGRKWVFAQVRSSKYQVEGIGRTVMEGSVCVAIVDTSSGSGEGGTS